MKYWIDLEIKKRVRLEVEAETRDLAENKVAELAQKESGVAWQRERYSVEVLAAFEPVSVGFMNPPFVFETPTGFAFSKAAHDHCVRIVAEVCGGAPDSWNGFIESSGRGCGSLSVRPHDRPTQAMIKEVYTRTHLEVTPEILECLVDQEIPK